MLEKQKCIRNPKAYEAYLNFIRSQPCCVGDGQCGKSSDPHHVDSVGAYGQNPHIIPLCRHHHSIFHSIGEEDFGDRYNLKIRRIASNLMWLFVQENWIEE